MEELHLLAKMIDLSYPSIALQINGFFPLCSRLRGKTKTITRSAHHLWIFKELAAWPSNPPSLPTNYQLAQSMAINRSETSEVSIMSAICISMLDFFLLGRGFYAGNGCYNWCLQSSLRKVELLSCWYIVAFCMDNKFTRVISKSKTICSQQSVL